MKTAFKKILLIFRKKENAPPIESKTYVFNDGKTIEEKDFDTLQQAQKYAKSLCQENKTVKMHKSDWHGKHIYEK